MRSPGSDVVTNQISNINETSIQYPTDFSVEICFQKYISKEFVDKKDINNQEVSQMLKQIEQLNNVIIGHLNVNSLLPKLDAVKTIITGNIDVMIFTQTKPDDSYSTAQLMAGRFKKPFRLDKDSNGGGMLIYVKSDIPSTLNSSHNFPDEIEGMFIEINLRKSKWLLFGTYHPPNQDDYCYIGTIGRALGTYISKYDKKYFDWRLMRKPKKRFFKISLDYTTLTSG